MKKIMMFMSFAIMIAMTATAQTVTPTVAPRKAVTTKIAPAPVKSAVKVVKPVRVTKRTQLRKALELQSN